MRFSTKFGVTVMVGFLGTAPEPAAGTTSKSPTVQIVNGDLPTHLRILQR